MHTNDCDVCHQTINTRSNLFTASILYFPIKTLKGQVRIALGKDNFTSCSSKNFIAICKLHREGSQHLKIIDVVFQKQAIDRELQVYKHANGQDDATKHGSKKWKN